MTDLTSLLNRALAALETGDLDVAEVAAREALKIDGAAIHAHYVLDQVRRRREEAANPPPPAEASAPETPPPPLESAPVAAAPADPLDALARMHMSASRKKETSEEFKTITRMLGEIEAGRLVLTNERRLLSHPHSPAGLMAFDSQIITGGLVLVVLAALVGNWTIAGGVAVILIAIYWLIIRRWQARRVTRYLVRLFRTEPESWAKVWAFGSVALVDPATGETCTAPDGSWHEFLTAYEHRQAAQTPAD